MAEVRALLVDDEPGVRFVLARALASTGVASVEAGSVAEARRLAEEGGFGLAFVDIRLPDGSGLEVAGELAARADRPFVVVMTAQDTVAHAIEATRQGADDYLVKPFAVADIQKLGRTALERARAGAVPTVRPEAGLYGLVGTSPAMREVYKRIGRVAQSDLPLVVEGESGSGRSVVARAVHAAGPRAAAPFVVLDPLTTDESAAALLRQSSSAVGGSLVVREPAAWSPARQEALLQVVSADTKRWRLLTLTTSPLAVEQSAGRLRPELALRLQVLTVRVPPLRERREDLPALVDHFLGGAVRLTPEALALLTEQELPGNIRQLSQILAAAAVESGGDTVTARLLAPLVSVAGSAVVSTRWEDGFARLVRSRLGQADAFEALLARAERIILDEALARAGGNQVKAASLLGLHRNSLRRRLEGAGGGGGRA